MAMTAGFLGGFGHCSGMCGPIVAAFTLKDAPARVSQTIPLILYNTGRVATYTALGAVAGALGSFVTLAAPLEAAQYVVMALAGIFMLLLGLSIAGLMGGLAKSIERHNTLVLRAARGALGALGMGSRLRFLPLGLVLGFLPCGLSYTMLIGAAGSGGAESGALTMLFFGLGTVPALFLVGILASRLGSTLRGRLLRAGGAVVALMGLFYIYRGVAFYAGL